jgi:hypothetical protein
VTTQKYRNKYGNLFRGKLPYLGDPDQQAIWKQNLEEWGGNSLMNVESELEKQMRKLLKSHPWSAWFDAVKGVGPVIAASIIGELDGARYGHIEEGQVKEGEERPIAPFLGYGREFESTADLWSYAGWGVRDGKAAKRKKGEASAWNNYLKLACYKFIESTIKSRGTYREAYDTRKEYEAVTHPELTKGHINNRAKRYTIKKFLSDINHNLILATKERM